MTDQQYMQEAISQAQKARGFTSPNPCVGAVVVKNGTVVGKGFHKAAGMPHAEVEAIDDAGQNARGATIYVTLEPCNHFGKTPPCTHKIQNAGIARVVIGCPDPNPYVDGGGIAFLKERGIEVISGVLQEECRVLIEEFIWYSRNNKTPFVILKSAATLDGFIGTSTGDSKWITGRASRQYGHRIRHEVDAILIGSGTLHADDPCLTSRLEGVQTKNPVRVVLDTRLAIREDARVLQTVDESGTIIFTGPDADEGKIGRIERKGARVFRVAVTDSRLDLNEVMIKLGQMSVLSVLIEGGGTVASQALKAGIVNKMLYFIAPKFLGGSDGIPVFNGTGPEKIKDAFTFRKVVFKPFNEDLLVEGYLK